MANQPETGVAVNVPDSYSYADGVPVRVPDSPESTSEVAPRKSAASKRTASKRTAKKSTATGQTATTTEEK